MHPPTPYPASARTKSRMRDTAFCEITSKANAVSKSEQDFLSVMRKAEEEATRKPAKTPIASRRYSVASKFAGPKSDNVNALSSDSAVEVKPKLNKRASYLGIASGLQLNGASTQASRPSGKSIAAPSSKTFAIKPTISSVQATNLRSLPKRQSFAPEQVTKLHKPNLDLHKKAAFGPGKAESAEPIHTLKARAMLLKSACYWLDQVKLAESLEKHGVSTGFFRLAVECEAEPEEVLREELIAYIKRHSLWSDAIQQVLSCYSVTDEAQHTLFSQMSAKSNTESSSPDTPAKHMEGILSNDKDLANQNPEKDRQSLDASFDNDNIVPKDLADKSNIKEEVVHSENISDSDASGHIESMDADTITRVVVSYIMSSVNHPDSSKHLKDEVLAEPKDSFLLSNSKQNRQGPRALLVGEDSVLCVRESKSVLNLRDPEEAVPTGSPPSLSVWNTFSKEAAIGKFDLQEEVSITLDTDITDSVSTEKRTGEEMCISMELDVEDTASDNLSDLQSKSPACNGASSEESSCHVAQTANERLGNAVKASDINRCNDEAISVDQNNEGLPKSSVCTKSHDKVSGTVQVSEKCESGSHKGRKNKSASLDIETGNCTDLQINCLLDSQGHRRSSPGFGRRSQNGKEKLAPVSDRKKTNIPAPHKDNAAAVVAQKSRHVSISTPKTSISAYVPNIDAGSKTRRKSRISQITEPGIENNELCLKSPTVGSEGILATPRQEKIAEVGDGSKQVQVSLNFVEGVEGIITHVMGSIATPGSEGIRRSARLMRGGSTATSTPGSVSTTRVQRQLGTPTKAEKEVV